MAMKDINAMLKLETTDTVINRIKVSKKRIDGLKADGCYYFNQPITNLIDASKVKVGGREMTMFASYSYLGLLGHPRINEAAKKALDKYGTGTHGVRTLAGSLDLHNELEHTIADFKNAEDAITYSSGYVTNLTAVSSLVGRHDVVFTDKYDHASIIDGCQLSGAKHKRFRHNDMEHLEQLLNQYRNCHAKLVVVDSVFSMDGDMTDIPALVELCQKYKAWLMVDEAHSLGVLGKTGRGVEEHFGLEDVIDVKMGTLSKTIPSVGGYLAGKKELISMFRHASRAYIFSAALPPSQAAAAKAAFEVILDEPERVEKLRRNTTKLITELKVMGYNTLQTSTPVVPMLCGSDEKAYELTAACQKKGIFVLPVVTPAVPIDLARLRTTVTAAHSDEQVDTALRIFKEAGKEVGII